MSWLERLADISETMPGWTVLLLTALLITLLIGGRILDIIDTVTVGVEARINQTEIGGKTLGNYTVDYGHRQIARGVWATVTSILAIVVTLFWVGKAVNALKRGGEVI